jgi:hypothetical protein
MIPTMQTSPGRSGGRSAPPDRTECDRVPGPARSRRSPEAARGAGPGTDTAGVQAYRLFRSEWSESGESGQVPAGYCRTARGPHRGTPESGVPSVIRLRLRPGHSHSCPGMTDALPRPRAPSPSGCWIGARATSRASIGCSRSASVSSSSLKMRGGPGLRCGLGDCSRQPATMTHAVSRPAMSRRWITSGQAIPQSSGRHGVQVVMTSPARGVVAFGTSRLRAARGR